MEKPTYKQNKRVVNPESNTPASGTIPYSPAVSYGEEFKNKSKTFSLAAKFLPKNIRDDITYLYYICRKADDCVDEISKKNENKNEYGRGNGNGNRNRNRNSLNLSNNPYESDIKKANQSLDELLNNKQIQKFFEEKEIPFKYYEDLIKGVRSDIEFVEFNSFEELYEYCYRVAGTVGIMSAHLFGVREPQALMKAEKLGVAMQITNIMRDVKEDSEMQRIYLPLQDLVRFDVSSHQISEHEFSTGLKDLMVYYEKLAREYYSIGLSGTKYISQTRIRLTVRLAGIWYRGILDKLKAQGYNPFAGRVYLSKKEKMIYIRQLANLP